MYLREGTCQPLGDRNWPPLLAPNRIGATGLAILCMGDGSLWSELCTNISIISLPIFANIGARTTIRVLHYKNASATVTEVRQSLFIARLLPQCLSAAAFQIKPVAKGAATSLAGCLFQHR